MRTLILLLLVGMFSLSGCGPRATKDGAWLSPGDEVEITMVSGDYVDGRLVKVGDGKLYLKGGFVECSKIKEIDRCLPQWAQITIIAGIAIPMCIIGAGL
jgi:hypothetical protein